MTPFAKTKHAAMERNEQERLARLPETTARYRDNLLLYGITQAMIERIPDPNCENCRIARTMGRLLWCGRCMSN